MKIIIDIEEVMPEDMTALVLMHPTGLYYTAQVGGVGCAHPEVEGFVLPAYRLCAELDTCEYGCHYISEDIEAQKRLARDFDILAKEYCKRLTFKVRFDYDRIEQTQEAFVPIIFEGTHSGITTEITTFKGFWVSGNCD
jgi:hypothetical protein